MIHDILELRVSNIRLTSDGSLLVLPMRPFNQLPQMWSSGNTHAGYNRPIANTKQHSFKPKAIRIPALLSLFFLFTICLVWLEILLERTVKPSEYYKSHGISDGLKKRQAAPPAQCPAPDINSQNLASTLR